MQGKYEPLSFLESNIVAPMKAREIDEDIIKKYQLRYSSQDVSITELYHENSKWNEYNSKFFILEKDEISKIKNRYLEASFKIDEKDINWEDKKAKEVFKDIQNFPHRLSILIDYLVSKKYELLYDTNLFLLVENSLYRCIPQASYLIYEKKILQNDINSIKNSVVTEEAGKLKDCKWMFFLVGVSWRNKIFYGERGYRIMLLQIGKLISCFYKYFEELEVLEFPCFYDNKINQILTLDGIESYVIEIVGILPKENEEP